MTPLAELVPLESSGKRFQDAQMAPLCGAADIASGLCVLAAATLALWDVLKIKTWTVGFVSQSYGDFGAKWI